jgi:hypothetical protein
MAWMLSPALAGLLHRYDDVLAALSDAPRPMSLEAIRTILSAHGKGPRSVCTHAGSQPEFAERSATLASVAIFPHARRFCVTDGPPCRAEYLAFPGSTDPFTRRVDGTIALPDQLGCSWRGVARDLESSLDSD